MRGGDQNPLDPKNSIVDMFPGLILRIFRPFGEAPSSIDAMSSPAFIIGEAVGRKLESSGLGQLLPRAGDSESSKEGTDGN